MSIAIVTAIGGYVAQWLAGKQEITKAAATAKSNQVMHHLNGWSDEFLTLVWAYPFVSMFIPYLQADTLKAFEHIETLPNWYIAGFMSITSAVFGINQVFKHKALDNKKKGSA